jgi:hypothetical protein
MAALSTARSTTSGGGDYPLTFAVDYPDRRNDHPDRDPRCVRGRRSLATNAEGSGARYAAGIVIIPVALMTVASPNNFTKVAAFGICGD